MKCLSVRSPWAELIAAGLKTIELRTWRLAYRGQLVIVSTSRPARSDAARAWTDPIGGDQTQSWPSRLDRMDIQMAPSRPLALVELFNVRTAVASDAQAACCTPTTTGERPEFAWELRLVQRLDVRDATGKPRTMTGQLSLYPPPTWLTLALSVRGVS